MNIIVFTFIGFFIILLNYKRVELFLVILCAYFVKLALVFTQRFVRPVFSSSDQVNFLNTAVEWSSLEFIELLGKFDPTQSYVISWVSALIFYFFGHEVVLVNILMSWIGLGTIIVAYKFSYSMSEDKRVAVLVSLLVAIIPSLSIINAALLRESFVIYFVILSFYYAFLWWNSLSIKYALLCVFSVVVSGFFHGALYFLVPFFAFIFLIRVVRSRYSQNKKFIYYSLFFVSLIPVFLFGYTMKDNVKVEMAVSMLSGEQRSIERLSLVELSGEGINSIAYPSVGGGFAEKTLLAPIRMAFFSYTPALWHFSKITDVPRIIDSILFVFFLMVAILVFIKNFRDPRFSYYCWFVFPVVLFLILMFSFGSFDVGTGQRHRLKFLSVVVVVYGSMFFSLFRKYNFYGFRRIRLL
ncbi:MAG: hypothetical protein IBX55_21845 [Methyloprofundus sp.]|nr:hypothetical protein [Methyloprofundus sp.]